MTIKTGTLVKIWHNGRGHDYAVACLNASTNEIGLIKNNCINNDGSIHAATRKAGKVHKWLTYNNLGGQRIVPRITRVLGDRELDGEAIYEFLREAHILDNDIVTIVHPTHNIYSTAQDNRTAVTY